MTSHAVATREEWLAVRKELLTAEKDHSRRGDELARRRRELPWVLIEKEYVFESDDGPKTLAELFDGRSQLLVDHFMFGTGCRARLVLHLSAGPTLRQGCCYPGCRCSWRYAALSGCGR